MPYRLTPRTITLSYYLDLTIRPTQIRLSLVTAPGLIFRYCTQFYVMSSIWSAVATCLSVTSLSRSTIIHLLQQIGHSAAHWAEILWRQFFFYFKCPSQRSWTPLPVFLCDFWRCSSNELLKYEPVHMRNSKCPFITCIQIMLKSQNQAWIHFLHSSPLPNRKYLKCCRSVFRC